MTGSIIHLNKSLMIAKGKGRIVYRHPDYPNQCLKIEHHKTHNENKIDLKYYQHLQNRGTSFKHIARLQGEQNTNKGNATVFDLVKDYDGEISKTLQYYLFTPPPENSTKIQPNIIAQHLLILKQYLLTERIVFRDLNPGNIVLCKINATDIRLIIVDGLGTRSLIPIELYVNFFAVRTIKRRWHHRMIERYYRELKPIFETLNNSSTI